MKTKNTVVGYLPDERPPLGKLIIFALQQIVVMFPATVVVALITGFHVSTTIFASGLATLCFILVTGRQIPLYYGSSFAYIAAVGSIMGAQSLAGLSVTERISMAQFGIVMSGFVSIIAGLIVNRLGKDAIEKVLPASITGSIAIIIGISLAGVAMGQAHTVPAGFEAVANAESYAWVIALITMFATILFSIYLRGTLSQLPILFGLITGYVTALALGMVSGIPFVNLSTIDAPLFNLPTFSLPTPNAMAVFAIMPIAIATIPESTAHIFQLDIYVNSLAKRMNTSKKYDLAGKLGKNLIGDGIGDIVSGMIGGPAGTNYGENISTMAISKNFSVPVLMLAACITMVISCFTPLINMVYSIPTPVIGGMSIYLFGVIAAQGIAIMMDRQVDMFSAKNLAVIALILIIGLGGHYGFASGEITMFGMRFPAIATAAVVGILMNALLSIGEKKRLASEVIVDAAEIE